MSKKKKFAIGAAAAAAVAAGVKLFPWVQIKVQQLRSKLPRKQQ